VNLKYTMTSREIAGLTGKLHKNVLRDIEEVFTQLNFEPSGYLDSYKDSTGRTLKQYRLDRNLTMTLVTKYDTARRYAVVRRWSKLMNRYVGASIGLIGCVGGEHIQNEEIR